MGEEALAVPVATIQVRSGVLKTHRGSRHADETPGVFHQATVYGIFRESVIFVADVTGGAILICGP